jgi:hypothetical protein
MHDLTIVTIPAQPINDCDDLRVYDAFDGCEGWRDPSNKLDWIDYADCADYAEFADATGYAGCRDYDDCRDYEDCNDYNDCRDCNDYNDYPAAATERARAVMKEKRTFVE